jgi:hypothetical protein
MRLTRSRWPSVIISASGMATGGRVLHHLKAMAPDARHHVCFPGFQVGGSRGAKLVAGATELKIFGKYVPVRAEISHLASLSGHADSDGLMDWDWHWHWHCAVCRRSRSSSRCWWPPVRAGADAPGTVAAGLLRRGGGAAAAALTSPSFSRSAARAATWWPPISRRPAPARRHAAYESTRAGGRS